ncbi:transcription factor MYBS3-like [Vigna unguiculata]|uniref:transcription factor MYBS3-like n=1 Tax=Vigna unguiculata TaxID=3917 RepID=UPI0010165486|nr:transcription factor MYBS3-like [Vigna unguiculata]
MAEHSMDYWKELSADWYDLIGQPSHTFHVPAALQSQPVAVAMETPLMLQSPSLPLSSSSLSSLSSALPSSALPFPSSALPLPSSSLLSSLTFQSNKRKRITWTEAEHKRFLEGLHKYGKGDWKNISAYIQTKTAIQVASHAQKYFIRQAQTQHQKKRKSIHDMVMENAFHMQNSSSSGASSQFSDVQPLPFNPHVNVPHPPELQPMREMMNQNPMNPNNMIHHPAYFNQMQPC